MRLLLPVKRPERLRILFVAVLLATSTCSDGSLAPTDGTLAIGTWGGDNAGVIVTESVTHVHVGCTFGDVTGEIAVAPDGRFKVDGSYVLRAYPVAVGPPLPAQFSGRISGRTLTLAIAVNDTVEKKVVALGPVTVVYGREPEMGPCPICRTPRAADSVTMLRRPATRIIGMSARTNSAELDQLLDQQDAEPGGGRATTGVVAGEGDSEVADAAVPPGARRADLVVVAHDRDQDRLRSAGWPCLPTEDDPVLSQGHHLCGDPAT